MCTFHVNPMWASHTEYSTVSFGGRTCGCQWLGGGWGCPVGGVQVFQGFVQLHVVRGRWLRLSAVSRVVGVCTQGGGIDFVTTNCEYVIRYGIIFSLYCRLWSGCLYTYSIYMLVSMCTHVSHTHVCIYVLYVYTCMYKKWYLYIKTINIVQYTPFVKQCGMPRWSCVVTPMEGSSNGCPALVSWVSFISIFLAVVSVYILLFVSCGFRIYITLVSMCIALWLGCQTICSNILSMHIYAWLIYAYMHG